MVVLSKLFFIVTFPLSLSVLGKCPIGSGVSRYYVHTAYGYVPIVSSVAIQAVLPRGECADSCTCVLQAKSN